MMRRGSATKRHSDRVAWLTKNIEHAIGVPGLSDDVTPSGRINLDALTDKMRELGLFGASTRDMQRETVRRLVSELRGERSTTGGTW